MTTTTRPVPWWRTAPNPPCAPWCTETHKPGEFSELGGMLCRRTIAATDTYTVEVQRFTGTTDAGDAYSVDDRPSVYQSTEADDITDADAHAFGVALLSACELIRQSVTR